MSYASLLAVVGLKRTWGQKLSSDLLLTFMTVHLFQFCFADVEKSPEGRSSRNGASIFSVSSGPDGNLSYTSVSCAQKSSEVRHYCVSDGTHCSADVWVVKLHVSISTSSWEWGPVASTPPTSLGSDCTYMWRNVVQTDGGIAYSVAGTCRGSSLYGSCVLVGLFFRELFRQAEHATAWTFESTEVSAVPAKWLT